MIHVSRSIWIKEHKCKSFKNRYSLQFNLSHKEFRLRRHLSVGGETCWIARFVLCLIFFIQVSTEHPVLYRHSSIWCSTGFWYPRNILLLTNVPQCSLSVQVKNMKGCCLPTNNKMERSLLSASDRRPPDRGLAVCCCHQRWAQEVRILQCCFTLPHTRLWVCGASQVQIFRWMELTCLQAIGSLRCRLHGNACFGRCFGDRHKERDTISQQEVWS